MKKIIDQLGYFGTGFFVQHCCNGQVASAQ